MFPKRKYIVKYETYETVEATTFFGAWDALKKKLKEESKDPDFDPDYDIDIIDAFEASKEYEVKLSSGLHKIRAEYHRDTSVMKHGNSEDPSGCYFDRPNGHLLFVSTGQLEKVGIPIITRSKEHNDDINAIKEQIFAIEDALGEHSKYNAIVDLLKTARKELPKETGENICYRCLGNTHEKVCICTENNQRSRLGCCTKCRGWGKIQMFIEWMFESSLKSELKRAWEWLYETGRCKLASDNFWKLMLEAAGLLELKDEITAIKTEVTNKE